MNTPGAIRVVEWNLAYFRRLWRANLLNSFLYKGPYGNHFCMVFEILGVNLL